MVKLGTLTAENEINVGDIVKLKSGGPDMTAAGFESEKCIQDGNLKDSGRYFVHAYYFHNCILYKEKFYKESLRVVNNKE